MLHGILTLVLEIDFSSCTICKHTSVLTEPHVSFSDYLLALRVIEISPVVAVELPGVENIVATRAILF